MLPVTGRYFDQTDSFCFDLKRLNFHFAFLSLFGHFLHPFLGSKGEIRYRYRGTGTYLLNKYFLLYKFVTGTVFKKKKKNLTFLYKNCFQKPSNTGTFFCTVHCDTDQHFFRLQYFPRLEVGTDYNLGLQLWQHYLGLVRSWRSLTAG